MWFQSWSDALHAMISALHKKFEDENEGDHSEREKHFSQPIPNFPVFKTQKVRRIEQVQIRPRISSYSLQAFKRPIMNAFSY
jgi:hypothetical protein